MLIPDERMLLMTYCHDHPVAVCAQCSEAVPFQRIGADIIMGRRDFCPVCRADLTTALRQHLAECTLMQVQAREILDRARETRQDGRSPADMHNRALTEPTRAGMIPHDGRACTPGPTC
jgi:hypothetical protein